MVNSLAENFEMSGCWELVSFSQESFRVRVMDVPVPLIQEQIVAVVLWKDVQVVERAPRNWCLCEGSCL